MADQVKQLAFKKFTLTELQNGTAANVVTTDASTHYVIKSIETKQNSNTDAIVAEATIGLTSGVSAGDFTSLGTVAKSNRLGSEGSVIMDASSTLSIRPTAKTINFLDEKVYSQLETNGSTPNGNYVTAIAPSVNGNAEPTLNSETTVDKTGVTFSGSYDSIPDYVAGNYRVLHTNANGVNLMLNFVSGSTSGCAFSVWNADTGAQYGYYASSYDRAIFDGSRYIFWCYVDGQSTMRVRWYDLDESTTNLAAANTTGGSNGVNFYHGQSGAFQGSVGFSGRTSYDNFLNAFYQNRHTNNKRYFCGYSNSNNRGWMVEFPDTLTNDASTTPSPKWVYLSSTSSDGSGIDPFGRNNGSAWNMTYMISSNYAPSSDYETQWMLTYDPVISRYLIWYSQNNNNWYAWTFTQAEFDATSNAQLLSPDGTEGLRTVAQSSAADINIDSSIVSNGGSSNLMVNVGQSGTTFATNTGAYAGQSRGSDMSPVYIDGSNFYFRNMNSSSDSAYKIIKVNMSDTDASGAVTNLMPNTTIPSNVYENNMFVGFTTPTTTQINARTYTKQPGLKVRVTGILSDQ